MFYLSNTRGFFALLILLFCSTAFFVFFPLAALAQSADPTDCNETSNYSEDQYVQKVKEELSRSSTYPTLKIFTDKDLKTALRFHQQYCCEHRVGDEKCEGKLDGKKYYAESPYIFDHLVAVGMRKFDGVEDNCDVLGIDCTTADNQKQLIERREAVREIALDTDGSPPAELLELFKKYRGSPDDFVKEQDKLANAYFQMCTEAVAIRQAVTINADAVDNKLTGGKGLFEICSQLVRQRYLQEAAFVQTVMVEKGIQYMYNNLQKYLQEYFITNRMNDFVDKFGKLDACFNMVLKYVTRTACCVN